MVPTSEVEVDAWPCDEDTCDDDTATEENTVKLPVDDFPSPLMPAAIPTRPEVTGFTKNTIAI